MKCNKTLMVLTCYLGLLKLIGTFDISNNAVSEFFIIFYPMHSMSVYYYQTY